MQLLYLLNYSIRMINHYSIKDLERITGIKAHTIRIWEKRYNIVEPKRSDTNIRNYCDHDLKRLLNISVLVKNGYKISHIAELPDRELCQKVLEINNVNSSSYSGQIESMIVAMIDLDEIKFEKVLNSSIIKHGIESTLFDVVYPLLTRIGILWQIGTITPAQEHFISNLIRQKIYAAIDGLSTEPVQEHKTFLLILPEWELHDMGLLVYNYLIRKKGHKTIFLGQGIPLQDVAAVKEQTLPDAIITSFSAHAESEEMLNYLKELNNIFPGLPIYVGGIQQEKLCSELPPNVQKVATALNFRDKVLNNY
ncbi:MAG: MerR family transcriptional regulator [Bacteroidales bacterium]|nr:MerR family transcriptional regulator [Bacteroidales bacterium]